MLSPSFLHNHLVSTIYINFFSSWNLANLNVAHNEMDPMKFKE